MRRDILVTQTLATQFNGGGTNYLIQTPAGVLYLIYQEPVSSDVFFIKSSDKGMTWSNQTVVLTTLTITQISVWYDRWSGIDGDLIHVVGTDSAADDIFYRNIDAGNADAQSVRTVVFAGASTAANGALTITRGRDGALRVAGTIDGGTEDGAWSSVDVGATWTDVIADPSEGTSDMYMLLPGWNADTADVQLIFWDISANELSVKRYDDSTDTWAESSIATGMADDPPANSFPHFAAFVDLENSVNVVAAWSGIDSANADLRIWTISDTTITEKTNVVLNSTDDQGLVALGKCTVCGTWVCAYAGKSDGTQTWNTSMKIYYKTSADGGTTWSAETEATSTLTNIRWLVTTPRFIGGLVLAHYRANTQPGIYINADVPAARVSGGY